MTKVPEKQKKSKRKLPPQAWKPGQSGNPAGRPKVGLSLAELLREKGEAGANAKIASAVVERAQAGDVAAAKLYWDRAYGQAPATVELNANIHSATVEQVMEHTRDWLMKNHPEGVVSYLEYIGKCQK